LPYGKHPRECLDFFPSATSNAKTLVFIHGGYWQMFDKSRFHFIADTFLSHNINLAIINYPLAPAETMDDMVVAVRKSILWLQNNLALYDADPQEIYVAGHSAGGHLAAMLLQKEWAKTLPYPLKGICAMSGLFDLRPIQLSYLNKTLHMDKEMAVRNSPIDIIPVQNCPVIVATGTAETSEFKDQGRSFYNTWKSKTASIKVIELEGLNHFSILDALVDENALLHKAVIKLLEN
jgi:arylformamidase